MSPSEREEMEEDIRQFLIESTENLALLDEEIVALEKDPEDRTLISSVFRAIHTIKGSCGFFGYDRLTETAHITENILAQVRADQRPLTPRLISLILESIDKIKLLLVEIDASRTEGEVDCTELIGRLEQAHLECDAPADHGSHEDQAEPEPEPEVEPEAEPEAETELEAPAPEVLKFPVTTVAAKPVAAVATEAGSVPERRKTDAPSTDSTIRVDVGLLDKLMNLVGELVLTRNQLLQDSSTQSGTLQKTSQRLNLITSELQEGVMKTRMQPIGVVWNKLPRVVRDLAAQCGKQIRLEMIGGGTELDKTIIEAIKDPLTHIVRNSCDHGVELPELREAKNKPAEGFLMLRAYHEGGVVNIEISDDGAGIDPAKMKLKAMEKGIITDDQAAQMSDRTARELIFAPGFSTAEKVTSISGRGVGMDVVKTNIEKIGGNVEIIAGHPYGTTIRIRIPLTLAIIPGLIVSLSPELVSPRADDAPRLRDERFVVPQANLLELVRLEGVKIGERIKNLHGTLIFHYRGKLLPLIYLRRVLGKPASTQEEDVVSIVVLHAEGRQMGLVVDKIHDTQEIVVKPLARQLKGLACYMGGTIMGDGLPALILDVAGLARLANLQGRQAVAAQESERMAQTATTHTQMLLLFRAGSFERLAVPLPLVARLEKIPTKTIERAGGHPVLHYRGEILPLISLASVLEPGCADASFDRAMIQVIVFTDGTRHVGLVIDEIIDIVDQEIAVRRGSSAPGLLGSAVIGDRITDLIDLHAVVEVCGQNWLDPVNASRGSNRVLLVDSCRPAREMISEYLEAFGYDVTAVPSIADAMPRMRHASIDLVIAAVEMQGGQGQQTLRTLRLDNQLGQLPIVGLIEHPDQTPPSLSDGVSYDACVLRTQRRELLDSISTLIRSHGLSREAMLGEVA